VLLCEGSNIPLVNAIKKINPELEFAGWIDTYKTGTLLDKPIIRPLDIRLGEDDFIIVATGTVINDALDFFKRSGLDESKYTIYFDKMLSEADLKQAE